MRTFPRGRKEQRPGPDLQGWLYGINPVVEALRAGRNIKKLHLSSGRHEKVAEIRREAEMRGIPIEVGDRAFFDARFPKGHQGVAARVLEKNYADPDDLLRIPFRANEIPLFLVLDGIEDPRNFGAILRSADAAGVHGVIIQSRRSARLSPEVSKSSAGAIEHVAVSMVPNIKHAIRLMKEEGISVVGIEADAATSLWETDLTAPLCLVVGSEGRGMRKTVREYCDTVVSLPMRGKVNSLNVSVATGIMLFEIVRQRLTKKRN